MPVAVAPHDTEVAVDVRGGYVGMTIGIEIARAEPLGAVVTIKLPGWRSAPHRHPVSKAGKILKQLSRTVNGEQSQDGGGKGGRFHGIMEREDPTAAG